LHYVVLYSHSWDLEQALKMRRAADLLRILLELKANPSIGDVDGLTPLHEAAALNQVWISSLLIHFGANVNAPAGPRVDNETPLHCAAWKRGRNVAPLLIEAGASVDAADSNGQTPLHYAVRKANEDMIRCLVQYGAAVDLRDREGRAPVDWADEAVAERIRALLGGLT
jgi:ankyrin repeat protein